MKNVYFVTSECRPFAASGGLGDVAGSLPQAIKKAAGDDIDMRVVMPLYSSISKEYRDMMTLKCKFYVTLSWRQQYCGVYELKKDDIIYYFLDNEYYFKRDSMYGSFDDGERYAYFCKAALDILGMVGFKPDILHANDWQTAMCVMYHKCRDYYPSMRCVYTIHNIEYQGKYSFSILGDVFDLSPNNTSILSFDDCLNLTKGAIVECDALTTVSPQYAKELQTEYFGHGLNGIISANSYKLRGILNGIDTDYYNPKNDKEIPNKFSVTNMAGKAKDKEALQKELGLEIRPDAPIIAMVSRLVSHKGLDLVKRVADEMLRADIQFVLLGTGESEYEDFFYDLASRYPGKVSCTIAFDKLLSKRIYAAADMFLMPSKSEPCGLAQMIAASYGTIPIVRETGGLYDSIKPYNKETGEGNGITFATYNAHDMLDAIWRALGIYMDQAEWKKLQKNAMKSDFTWEKSAKEYIDLYNSLC